MAIFTEIWCQNCVSGHLFVEVTKEMPFTIVSYDIQIHLGICQASQVLPFQDGPGINPTHTGKKAINAYLPQSLYQPLIPNNNNSILDRNAIMRFKSNGNIT